VAARAGLVGGELRSKAFRHSYCAAKLQTRDRGACVRLYTVSRELGHGSEEMVRRVYAHLGDVRHRSEVVEFGWSNTSIGLAIAFNGAAWQGFLLPRTVPPMRGSKKRHRLTQP
jgi:hypothetical protein